MAKTVRHGYTGRLLRVDLTRGETRVELLDEDIVRRFCGGGLLGTWLLLRETPAGLDPYDPAAPLLFLTGAVCGHATVALPRFSVVAKSPLTGGIGESRVEGPFGPGIKAGGVDGVVVTGRAARPAYLLVEPGAGEPATSLRPADDLWGLDTAVTTDALRDRHGVDAHVAAIGPAGERGVRFASIVTDRSYPAARMGLGAVMGARRLKAVVVTGGGAVGGALPSPADPAVLDRLTRSYAAGIAGNSLTRVQHEPPGFGAWVAGGEAVQGYLGVENYRTSRWSPGPDLSAERFLARLARSDGGCPGCPNDCLKAYANAVDPRAGRLHQEAVAALGPNLGITDLEALLDLNASCHLLGVDPVSLGFTLSFLCEAAEHGLVPPELTGGLPVGFGRVDELATLALRVAAGEESLAWLGGGVRRAAAWLGPAAVRFALHVKGLEMVSFEPRASAGQALAYAVSPLGPRYDIVEHDIDFDPVDGLPHVLDRSRTLGILATAPMARLDADRVARTAALLDLWSGLDALGVCLYASTPTRLLTLPQVAELVTAVTGWWTSDAEVLTWGRRRWQLMRVYNLREGIGADEDRLPDRFFAEAVDAGRHAGAVLDHDAFAEALALYYDIVGWDETGVPRRGTLAALGLSLHP